MLLMLSLLGVVVVSMLALLAVQRACKRTRAVRVGTPTGPTDMSVDAWTESGKRMDDSITEFDEEL